MKSAAAAAQTSRHLWSAVAAPPLSKSESLAGTVGTTKAATSLPSASAALECGGSATAFKNWEPRRNCWATKAATLLPSASAALECGGSATAFKKRESRRNCSDDESGNVVAALQGASRRRYLVAVLWSRYHWR